MALPNKITPKWIYKTNTKGPWSETRGPGIGGPRPPSCCSTAWIGHSNPYFSAVKYLHVKCCSIGTELNRASVLDEMWILIRLSAPNNNWVRVTMKPKWNLFGEKSLMVTSICLLSHWFYWCPHMAKLTLIKYLLSISWIKPHFKKRSWKRSS